MYMLYKVSPYGSMMVVARGSAECCQVFDDIVWTGKYAVYNLVTPSKRTYRVVAKFGRLTNDGQIG